MEYPCLILTADYRPKSILPLSTISWQESFRLLFLKKISVLEWYDAEVHTPTTTFKIPALAAIKRFTYNKSDKTVRFSRQNIFIRDCFTCLYCDEVFSPKELTIDHVIPRSKGGENSWKNAASCCKVCNLKKGNTVGVYVPKYPPFVPDQKNLVSRKHIISDQIKHDSWRTYLE